MFRRFLTLPVVKELSPNVHPSFQAMKPLIDQTFVGRSTMQSQISKLHTIYCGPALTNACSTDFFNSAIYFASIHCKKLSTEQLNLCHSRLKELQPAVLLVLCEKLLKSSNWHIAEQLIAVAFGEAELEALLFKFEVFSLSGYFAKMREILSQMSISNLMPIEVIKWSNAFMSDEMHLSKLPVATDFELKWRKLLFLILKGRILSSNPPAVELMVKSIECLEPLYPLATSLLKLLYMRLDGSAAVLQDILPSKNIKSKYLLFLALRIQPAKFSYAMLLDSYAALIDRLIAKTAIEAFGAVGDFFHFAKFCLERRIPVPQTAFAKAIESIEVPEDFIQLAHRRNLQFSPSFYERLLEKQLSASEINFYASYKLLKRCKSEKYSTILLEKAIICQEIEMAFQVFKVTIPNASIDSFVTTHLSSFLYRGEIVDGQINGDFNLFKGLFFHSCHRQLQLSQRLCQKGLELALLEADFSFASQLRSYMNNYNYCDSGAAMMRGIMSIWKNIYK